MISIWTEKQDSTSLTESDIIQEGLDKLIVYRDRANLVPAYIIAMSKHIYLIDWFMQLIKFEVLNPLLKLQHYTEHEWQRYPWAKGLLRETVSESVIFLTSSQCYYLLPYHT